MAAHSVLSESQKRSIYNAYTMGESQAELSELYGVSKSTIYRVITSQRGEQMSCKSKVVAGDKAHGRLMTTADQHKWEGTCIAGGKSKSKTFFAKTPVDAREQWEKWCSNQRDEEAFMAMVERKAPEEPKDEPKDEPIEQPKEEATEEPQELPKDEPRVAYVITCMYPEPRPIAVYTDMEKAMEKYDALTEAVALIGQKDAFTIGEAPWED